MNSKIFAPEAVSRSRATFRPP